jgi:hypothetical protein
MNPEHKRLARELAAAPEDVIANPAEPLAFDLVVACAKNSYEEGTLYLFAMQARRRAAECGSSSALMR